MKQFEIAGPLIVILNKVFTHVVQPLISSLQLTTDMRFRKKEMMWLKIFLLLYRRNQVQEILLLTLILVQDLPSAHFLTLLSSVITKKNN